MRSLATMSVVLVLAATGCSDDDAASPLKAATSQWQAAYRATVDSFCACATVATSDYCAKEAADCYASVDACKADSEPNVDNLDCYGAALQLDEEAALAVAECYQQAASAAQACFAAVQDCSAPAINACIQSYDAANRACPALPEAVVAAYAKCQ